MAKATTTNDINTEIILAEQNGRRTSWFPERRAPLQVRRGTKVLFSAATENIWEWENAPQHVRVRAQAIADRAGVKINDVACVAYDCPTVFMVNTPALAARIRELLPAARQLHAEAEARRIAEERAAEEERARRVAEVRAACPADCEPCTLGRWFDGLRECIADDGTRVDQWDDIDTHGCGIAYVRRDILDERRAQDAEEREAAAEREAEREAERRAAEERRSAAFEKARATGERQLIRHYATTHCMNGNDDECSLDNAYEYAMPDGTTKTIYVCAF